MTQDTASPYLEAFRAAATTLSANGHSWLAPVRREAIDRFSDLGFPTTKLEEWRYTSVEPIAKSRYRPAPAARASDASLRAVVPGEAVEGTRIVFVNGRFVADLSSAAPAGGPAIVTTLDAAMRTSRDRVEPHLSRHVDWAKRAFAALNTAFFEDGALVHLPRGTIVELPIQIVFLTAGSGEPFAVYPRVLVVAEEGAQAKIVEIHAALDEARYLTNAVTEIVVGAGAAIDHCKIQRDSEAASHVSTTAARVGRDASLVSHSIALGGALTRNDLDVLLAEEGGDCTLNGLYVLRDRQHVDNHTVIDHAKPHGTSRELYKGVLDGSSRAVFDGKVIVRPDAQKTDAQQVNRNLVVSREALVNTKPQLEIRADDVKCSHAATIGQLDDQMLFYLRSRGIGRPEAQSLLMHAFVGDVLARIRVASVREALEQAMNARLPQAPVVEAAS